MRPGERVVLHGGIDDTLEGCDSIHQIAEAAIGYWFNARREKMRAAEAE